MALEVPDLRDGTIMVRPWRDDDVETAIAICQDPEIARWTRVPSPYREQDALEFFEVARDGWETGASPTFAVVEAAGGQIVGSIGVRINAAIGDIGYVVSAVERLRGFGTRAVLLVCRWAFEELGLERLQITVQPENTASQRLAEKAGFRREGVLRSYLEIKGGRADVVMFSLLPNELSVR